MNDLKENLEAAIRNVTRACEPPDSDLSITGHAHRSLKIEDRAMRLVQACNDWQESLREEERPTQDGVIVPKAMIDEMRRLSSGLWVYSAFSTNYHAGELLRLAERIVNAASPALSEGVEGVPSIASPQIDGYELLPWSSLTTQHEYAELLLVLPDGRRRAFHWHPKGQMHGGSPYAYHECGAFLYRSVPPPQESAPTAQQLLQTILNAFEAASDDMIAAPGFDVLHESVIAAAARLVNRASAPVEEGHED